MLYAIIGFFTISILGSLFHFIYDWTNHNKFISIFVAVNESTWEHLKIGVIPTLLWILVGMFLKINNIAVSGFIAILTICLVIPLIFYTYTIFTKPILIIDILSFFFAIGLAMFFSYLISKANTLPKPLQIIGIIGTILFTLAFIIFTFYPPKLFLFKDPITNNYGIQGHYYKR